MQLFKQNTETNSFYYVLCLPSWFSFQNTCTLFCVCMVKPRYQGLFLEIFFAHAYRSFCHAIHHVCIGLSYRFGSHSDTISVQTNSLIGILFSSRVSVACLFTGSCTRHRSSMVSFLCFMCVFGIGFLFTMVLVTGLIRWEFVCGLLRRLNHF